MTTWATLVEIMHDGKLLLKRSTRGVSKSKWNGVGGKIDEGETPEENAIRETLEESGLTVTNLFYHGVMNFHNYGKEEVDFAVHLFSTKDFSGKLLKESDDNGELKWFPLDNLPMNDMWKDDEHWLPHMLAKEKFDADFYMDEGNKNIIKHEIRVKS
ncbi:MAG TPA: 8-oxo-dGTP diphosphatase [Candidatus Acidoferrum sp.]|nr:8-oxo-dGTP diphosphatase [Candidatus Acidoferrum sp.]